MYVHVYIHAVCIYMYLTCKVLAVKIRHRISGTGQDLQHLHVLVHRCQMQCSVALAVGEIDGGPSLHQHLHYVWLSCNNGQVEGGLSKGCIHVHVIYMQSICVYSNNGQNYICTV